MQLTQSGWSTKTDTYANSVDPEETARNEPSHLDLHCLPFGSRFFLTDIPICNNGNVQIQRLKGPLQKRRDEGLE